MVAAGWQVCQSRADGIDWLPWIAQPFPGADLRNLRHRRGDASALAGVDENAGGDFRWRGEGGDRSVLLQQRRLARGDVRHAMVHPVRAAAVLLGRRLAPQTAPAADVWMRGA